MWMDEGLDTGDILLQEAVTLRRHETAQTLHDRLAKIGADLLLKSIPLVETGQRAAHQAGQGQGDADEKAAARRTATSTGTARSARSTRTSAR